MSTAVLSSSSSTGPGARRVRLLVVDDHPVVRSGIVGMFSSEADLAVVGEAADGDQAVELVAELAPDVVLMDLRMPGVDGVEAIRRISAGAAAVDLLYEHLPDFLDRRVLILGAGQMAEVITDRLRELEHPAFGLYNRTKSRAESFATKHGITSVYSEDQLPEALASHDITFVATSSLSPIVTQEVLPHEPRAQVFFDLAVPRNVDPALEEYHHLHLYTIDDLRRKGGQLLHPQDQRALTSYLESMVSDFIQWCEAAEVREVIGLIQQVSQQILHKELSHLPNTLDEETKALIGQWDEHLRITYTTAIVSALRELSEESV